MKKNLILLSMLAAFVVMAANPSGTWMTWYGSKAGNNSNGSGDSYYGAYAGYGATNAVNSTYLGRLAGTSAKNSDRTVAVGFGAANAEQNNTNVVAIGSKAGQGTFGCKDSVFIGTEAGKAATNSVDGVYIGKNAGIGIVGETGGVDINGVIVHNGSTMSINANGVILCRDGIFSDADADLFMSAKLGNDANAGTNSQCAVASISGVVSRVNALVANETFQTNAEIRICVDSGEYKSSELLFDLRFVGTLYFKSVDGKRNAIITPTYDNAYNSRYGSSNVIQSDRYIKGMKPLFCCSTNNYCHDAKAVFDGFTITAFDGLMGSDYGRKYTWYTPIVGYGVTLRNCDITGNKTHARYNWLECDMEDCRIYNNVVYGVNNYAAGVAIGHGTGTTGPNVKITRCIVKDNVFVSEKMICYLRAYDSLFINDFAYSKAGVGIISNCTFIADRFQNDARIDGLSNASAYTMLCNNNLIVCPNFNKCSDSVFYKRDSTCLSVSNLTLTADYIAGDITSPAVRDDGMPDYGYKSSGFGFEKSVKAGSVIMSALQIKDEDTGEKYMIKVKSGELKLYEIND